MEMQAELNRLAGTTGLDETLAANVYAGTTGLEMLAALNVKAGTTGLELALVCNRLAGTTGLEAKAALEQATGSSFPSGTNTLNRWKANDLALADGTAVTSWTPTVGSVPFLQTTTASKPLLRTNVLNGKSVVRFDGVDDWMDGTLGAGITAPFSVYLLFMANPVSNVNREMLGGNWELYLKALTSTTATRSTWTNADRFFGTYTQGTWELWSLINQGASSPLYVNGTLQTAGNFSNAVLGTALALGRHTNTFSNFSGDMAELVICNGAHDSTQIANMHAYFKAEYGLAAIP